MAFHCMSQRHSRIKARVPSNQMLPYINCMNLLQVIRQHHSYIQHIGHSAMQHDSSRQYNREGLQHRNHSPGSPFDKLFSRPTYVVLPPSSSGADGNHRGNSGPLPAELTACLTILNTQPYIVTGKPLIIAKPPPPKKSAKEQQTLTKVGTFRSRGISPNNRDW